MNAQSDGPVHCTECGASLHAADRFCTSCGRPVPPPTEPLPPAETTIEPIVTEDAPPADSRSTSRETIIDDVSELVARAKASGQLDAPPVPPALPPPQPLARAPMPGAPPEPAPAFAGYAPPPGPPPPAVPPPTSGVPAIPDTWRTGITIGPHPLELWIVIVLFALPGAFITITALDALFNAFELLDFDGRLGLAILLLVLIVISIGAAFLGIAWMLYRRSRAGRGLAYVVAGTVFLSVVLVGSQGEIGPGDALRGAGLLFVASLIAITLLALAPAVRDVFTGSDAPAAAEPTSVVIARVCLAAAIWANSLLALVLLLIGDIEGNYYAYGLFMLGAVAVLVNVFTRLRGPDRQARVIASAAAGVAIVVNFLGPVSDGVVAGLAAPITVLVCLWLMPDARAWFGDNPITVSHERTR